MCCLGVCISVQNEVHRVKCVYVYEVCDVHGVE